MASQRSGLPPERRAINSSTCGSIVLLPVSAHASCSLAFVSSGASTAAWRSP